MCHALVSALAALLVLSCSNRLCEANKFSPKLLLDEITRFPGHALPSGRGPKKENGGLEEKPGIETL